MGRLDRGPFGGRARRVVDALDRHAARFEHVHRTRLREAANRARHRSSGHDHSLDEIGLEPSDVHEPPAEVFDTYGFER